VSAYAPIASALLHEIVDDFLTYDPTFITIMGFRQLQPLDLQIYPLAAPDLRTSRGLGRVVSAGHPTTSTREADMTGNQAEDRERQALLAFLAAQRDAVLSIVAGLDEEAWHRSVVPSGWTPAGLVEHLGGAEWHWFQGVVTGADPEPPPADEDLPPYDPKAAFVSDEPSVEIIGFYRDQCARSDAVLAVTPLSAPPRGRHGDPEMGEPPNVRWIVLHMIEETARHAGHLDIARELIDGQTGLGPR
jgi:hypothetical protein